LLYPWRAMCVHLLLVLLYPVKGDVCPSSFCIAISREGRCVFIFPLYCYTREGRCVFIFPLYCYIREGRCVSIFLLYCYTREGRCVSIFLLYCYNREGRCVSIRYVPPEDEDKIQPSKRRLLNNGQGDGWSLNV
jgi:hypothetical protein